jgi:hypothetical protein
MSVKNEAVYYRILRKLNAIVKFGKATNAGINRDRKGQFITAKCTPVFNIAT